ncbi:glyoxalase superfamily protein [Nocardia sp. NPDC047648]|uniref:glyoxalase superfamily protein n=1 Tax=Nocardia sp. NPDC047648 TaxID=3155625 RepID=UPI0033C84336
MTAVHCAPPVPVLRMFDVARTYEFYRDHLGFTVDWEHRFGAEFPLYAQVPGPRRPSPQRAPRRRHAGQRRVIAVGDVFAWHAELSAERSRNADPSGNVLRFAQPK